MPDDLKLFNAAYDGGSKPWDSGVPSVELLRILDEGGFPEAPGTVLELGCGTGTNAVELARRGYTVTAVDFVPGAVELARKRAEDAGVSVSFKVADVTEEGLDGPYELIFDRGVYHHIRSVNLNGFLRTMKNVTETGSRWFSLAGNAKEQTEFGPPRVHEEEFRSELGPLFEFLEVKECRIGTDSPAFCPLFWAILMERKG